LLQHRVGEASKIIPLEQILSVVDATSQVGDVETNEGVGAAGITSKFQGFGVCSISDCNILEYIRSGVLVACRATVLL